MDSYFNHIFARHYDLNFPFEFQNLLTFIMIAWFDSYLFNYTNTFFFFYRFSPAIPHRQSFLGFLLFQHQMLPDGYRLSCLCNIETSTLVMRLINKRTFGRFKYLGVIISQFGYAGVFPYGFIWWRVRMKVTKNMCRHTYFI